MNADSIARLDSYLSTAVRELFIRYDQNLSELAFKEMEIQEPFAATIGFTAPRLRGVLVLIADRIVIERSLPANLRASEVEDAIVADWTGELANQVLGKLKKSLYATGIDIQLSTPAVFAGKGLRHFAQHSNLARRLLFQGDGLLIAELQADFDQDLEIGAESIDETSQPEGETLFF